jgi:tripartite motif-containing protein 71
VRGLAIDQDRNLVYVVDAAGNKVHKFNVAGVPDPTTPCIGSEGTGSAAAPAPLGKFTDGGREATVDGDGNLWVGDMPNFRAQKFSPTGTALLQVPAPTHPKWAPPPGGFNGPRGVAVDKFGNMFVTDTYNQRVQKLNPNGSFNTQWGSRGRDDYAFNYPRMIATDPRDGAVVVADTDNHRIKKYTNDGVFVCEVGGLGRTALGTFRNPHGVDVGGDGRIYVADTRNARVQILDQNCNAESAFTPSGGGLLSFPRGIAVDPVDNSIWVADSGRDIVLHFSNAGSFIESIGTKGTAVDQWSNPFDIEVDGTNIYVADTNVNKVKIWTKNGVFQNAFGSGGKSLGRFQQPQGLDLHNGNLYVAEQKNERVQELDLG